MFNINTLEINSYEFCYFSDQAPGLRFQSIVDFVMDHKEPFSRRLGLWDMHPWFGRTVFDGNPPNAQRIAEFLGDVPATNQLGSGRLVLYGCHCGCDYCGVISCRLRRENGRVYWEDIHAEEFEVDDTVMTTMPQLVFDEKQYREAVANFLRQNVPFA